MNHDESLVRRVRQRAGGKRALAPAVAYILAFALIAPSTLAGCGSEAPDCDVAGVICTFAGTGKAGLGKDGVAPTAVSLYLPQDLTFGPDGRAYIVDWNNHRIRVIDQGKVQTLIGTGELGDAPDGDGLQTRLNHPTHVAFSPDGKLILSAWHNSKVMQYDLSTHEIKAICGNGERTYAGEGAAAKDAKLDLPVATAFDSQGRMLIMDQANQRIRRVEGDGTLHTVVGPVGPFLPAGYVEVCKPGSDPGQAPECKFCKAAEAADPACKGPPARPQGFAGSVQPGAVVGSAAYMNQPFSQSAPPAGGMEMGPGDKLVFADSGNHVIRMLLPDGSVQTIAGTEPKDYDATTLLDDAPAGGYGGDGGPATAAKFSQPRDVAVHPSGVIFVADKENNCVRRIDLDGTVHGVAGTCGKRGYGGDFGPADEALLNRPYGVALDAEGNLYIADTYNHRIRVVHQAVAN